jgi:hypothetical protein
VLSARASRFGATLAELLVALTLAAIVLGAATSTLLRQRRTAFTLDHAARGDAQLRAAIGALTAELGVLTAGSGDITPGQASDTAVQLRSAVVSGLACGDAVGSATFAGEDEGPAGVLLGAAPREGDTLWWFGGEPSVWRGRRIVRSDSIWGPCQLGSSPAGPVRRVTLAEPDSIAYGAPLRVTRPVRYAFYRSGDGSWQLGVRDWLGAAGRFASPQPLAGPFLMRAGSGRTGFHFFDTEGVELDAGTEGAADRVARVRVSVIAAGGVAAAPDAVARRDSMDVALQRGGVP